MTPAAKAAEQRMLALERANQRRTFAAQVRVEIVAGTLTVPAALDDPRAQSMPIGRLMLAQPRWGRHRVDGLLGRNGIWPQRRVRDLTERQRRVVVEATTPKEIA